MVIIVHVLMSLQLVKKALSDTLNKEKRDKTKKKRKTRDTDKHLDAWMISFSDDESYDHKEIKARSGVCKESRNQKSQELNSRNKLHYNQKCKKLRYKVFKKMTRYIEEQKRSKKEDRCVSKEAIKASVRRKRRKLLRLKEKQKQFNVRNIPLSQ